MSSGPFELNKQKAEELRPCWSWPRLWWARFTGTCADVILRALRPHGVLKKDETQRVLLFSIYCHLPKPPGNAAKNKERECVCVCVFVCVCVCVCVCEHLFPNNSEQGSVKSSVHMHTSCSLRRPACLPTHAIITTTTGGLITAFTTSVSLSLSSFLLCIAHFPVEEGLGLRTKDLSALSVQPSRRHTHTHSLSHTHTHTLPYTLFRKATKDAH